MGQTKTVYRLEHRFVKPLLHNKVMATPYSLDISINYEYYLKKYTDCDIMATEHAFLEDRPTPIDDGLPFIGGIDLCGCPSEDALFDWFGDFTIGLIKLGFVIREYKVKKMFIGKSKIQCVFCEDDIISRKLHYSKKDLKYAD